ncbi:Dicer-like protein 1 [Chytridiales sp. JEL 0842]|nr:Dicer-like protein 1 [Chytridiales sp. JEL 0842]
MTAPDQPSITSNGHSLKRSADYMDEDDGGVAGQASKRIFSPTPSAIVSTTEDPMPEGGTGTPPTNTYTDSTHLVNFVPRKYQLQIFERAKQSNIVSVLETGTGKTLIALLLIKYMIEKEKENKRGRVAIFLAPTIPLVNQQADFLSRNLDFKVEQYHGGKGVDKWDVEQWNKNLAKIQCLVMIPAICEYSLRRGYLSMDKICLIVFDECHHARKTSPYSSIMKLYYGNARPDLRPKIFGMTASPSVRRQDSIGSIRELEETLHATAITADDFEDLRTHINRPKEQVVLYAQNMGSSALITYLKTQDLPEASALLADAEYVFSELGSFYCDIFLKVAIAEGMSKTVSAIQEAALDPESENAPTSDPEAFPSQPADILKPESQQQDQTSMFLNLWKAIQRFEGKPVDTYLTTSSMDSLSAEIFEASWPDSTSDLISPKLQVLVNTLKEAATDEKFRGVLFVDKRSTAKMIGLILSKMEDLKFLKIKYIVGHGQRSGTKLGIGNMIDSGMTAKIQQGVVHEFRSGNINLLIATRVAEEGLDIPSCNIVIRFDMFSTLSQYIQSRGRARSANSRFVLMVQENDRYTLNLIEELREEEEDMQDVLADNANIVEENGERVYNPNIEADIYKIPQSGAMITSLTATAILRSYCQTLPHDGYSRQGPEFIVTPTMFTAKSGQLTLGYVAAVNLPIASQASKCVYHGDPKVSEGDAKQSAAFHCVVALYERGEITDRLRPSRSNVPEKASLQSGSKVADGVEVEKITESLYTFHKYDIPVPKPFQEGWGRKQGWLSVVKMSEKDTVNADAAAEDKMEYSMLDTEERFLHLGVLTCGPMPPEVGVEEEFKTDEHEYKFHIYPSQQQIDLTENMELVRTFQKVFYSCLLRSKVYTDRHEDPQFMVVPLVISEEKPSIRQEELITPELLIDWEMLKEASHYAEKMGSFERITSKIIARREAEAAAAAGEVGHKDKMDFVKEIKVSTEVPDVKNMFTDCERAFSEKAHDLVIACDYLHRRKLQVIGWDDDAATKQRAVEAFRRNTVFEEGFGRIVDENQSVILAMPLPRMLQTKREATKMEMFEVLPQFCVPYPLGLNEIVKSAVFIPFIVRTLHHRISVLDIYFDVGLENAISPGGMYQAFTSPAAATFYHYERFEFLGDCFLKMILSLHLYIHHPDRHEGWLTESRRYLERNMSLMKRGVKFNFSGAVLVNNLSRKLWCPPLFSEEHIFLTNKTIADIVEAVIGASVVDMGVPGALQSVKRILLPELEDDISNYSKIAPGNGVSMADFQRSTRIETDLSHNGGFGLSTSSLHHLTKRLNDILGYKFKDPILAVTALTHPTGIELHGIRVCYQRLEFLGDAVLDFVVAKSIFKRGTVSPGDLSAVKSELVNNQFLSAVSYYLGLPKLMYHTNSQLANQMSSFGQYLDAGKDGVKKLTSENQIRCLFWRYVPEAPKSMSDIFEALIGAVFIDSKMDTEASEDFGSVGKGVELGVAEGPLPDSLRGWSHNVYVPLKKSATLMDDG